MAKTAAKRKERTAVDGLPRPWTEFLGVALLAVGALMLGGLLSYQVGDGGLMGPVGRLVASALYASFGMAGYLVTLGVLGMGCKALLGQRMELGLGEGLGFTVATVAGCVLLHVMFPTYRVHGYTAGGLTGEFLGEICLGLFHYAGTYLVSTAVMCGGLIASTPFSSRHLVVAARFTGRAVGAVAHYLWDGVVGIVQAQREAIDEARAEDEREAEAWEEAYGEGEGDEADDDGDALDEALPEVLDGEDEYEDEDEADEADEDAADDDEADDREADAGQSANRSRGKGKRHGNAKSGKGRARKGRTRKGPSSEQPEIVMQEDPPAPKRSTSAKSAPAKKAPPRPQQLEAPVQAANGAAGRNPTAASKAQTEQQGPIPGIIPLTDAPYALPPLKLFEAAEKVKTEVDRKFVLEQADRLVNALAEFKIRGKVTKIHPGPVITRYEFKPEAGVKLSKIESLESDIAMALEAIRIRILAPIPGKATVGFEVPNKTRETVYIKEILDEDRFGNGMKLPLALGKDIVGKARCIDLAKAPHLLVAGATGSGKSVGVNSMISSLIYTSSPEDVRTIMIDPKMLELSIYEGIPHLLLPVVTDAEKANLALRWAVEEMERRYNLLSKAQVRDIAGYNRKLPELVEHWESEKKAAEEVAAMAARDAAEAGEDGAAGKELPGIRVDGEGQQTAVVADAEIPEKPTKLPYVVVIIDEFADLMMVASKEVEQNVARIAAKARAAGIHLILATQRPSVDVITGTIKNNFPSRIAFQVTSDADSRTILDGKGAKQLLGMGDMLYMDRGGEPQRVHGCFVSEDEILKVVKFAKKQAKPVYNMDIVRKREDIGGGDEDDNVDPLYDKAVQLVAEAQKVSTSMLQRRLNIGYNRAAKIVERMEEQGVIGPARGTSPREVYVTAA